MQSKLYDFEYHKFINRMDQTQENIVTWCIPDFEWLLNNQTNREIRTNKAVDYPYDTNDNFKIQLKIRLLGKENDLIEIYYMASASEFAKYTVTMDGNYSEKIIATKKYHWVQANKWQLLGVQYKQNLYEQDLFINNGLKSICLKFKFTIDNTNDIEGCNNMPTNKEKHNNVSEAKLNNDLENLSKNATLSDVTIKSVEGVEFQAHKVILVSRSSVLNAHFEHNTVESLTNIVESPLEMEVLQEVLGYIYTDKAPKVDDIPEKLLEAADFYQLNGLKSLCEEALHKKLSVENAIETLQLAALHTAANLKKLTVEFINDGQAKEIIKTKGWKMLQSAELVKIIYEHNIINN